MPWRAGPVTPPHVCSCVLVLTVLTKRLSLSTSHTTEQMGRGLAEQMCPRGTAYAPLYTSPFTSLQIKVKYLHSLIPTEVIALDLQEIRERIQAMSILEMLGLKLKALASG